MEFLRIPDWHVWERRCVKDEMENEAYSLDIPVNIAMLVNMDCVYKVGEGGLTHGEEGFRLTGCGGKLAYSQAPLASYSLYSD